MSCVLSPAGDGDRDCVHPERSIQRWRSATIYGPRCFRGNAPTDDRFLLPIRSAADYRSGDAWIVPIAVAGRPVREEGDRPRQPGWTIPFALLGARPVSLGI